MSSGIILLIYSAVSIPELKLCNINLETTHSVVSPCDVTQTLDRKLNATQTLENGHQEVLDSTRTIADTSAADLNDTRTVHTAMNSTQTISDPMNSTKTIVDPMNTTKTISDPMNSTKTISNQLNSTKTVVDALDSTQTISDSMNSTQTIVNPLNSTKSIVDPAQMLNVTQMVCDASAASAAMDSLVANGAVDHTQLLHSSDETAVLDGGHVGIVNGDCMRMSVDESEGEFTSCL